MRTRPVNLRLEDAARRRAFRQSLLRWYDRNKRDLPWRADRDPYRVWVSEVMLQQTRVNAVLDYYLRFLKRFPNVHVLAKARIDSVLAAWSGLGYYRRARMLHAAAKTIVSDFGGRFPANREGLSQLPGIGRYTSAAIASIAFGERVAVVDGNVERVLARVTGRELSGEAVWKSAQQFLSPPRPGDFNQAMMELGATLCLPKAPQCNRCPVIVCCATRGALPNGEKEARQKRSIHYGLSLKNGAILLKKRPPQVPLMPGMWELPELAPANGSGHSFQLKHSITVTDYSVHVSEVNISGSDGDRWIPRARVSGLPLTGLTRKILRAAGII